MIGRPLTLLGLLILLLPAASFAHTTGASWNQTSGVYTVDVGYDPVTFTAGQYTRFDLLLWQGPANTGESAAYDQVWIRITDDSRRTLLATGVWHQPIGPTTLLYLFERPGSYTLETSFRDADSNEIAVASFPITVEAVSGGVPGIALNAALFFAGLVVGAGALLLLRRRT
jgi:hypothetical protein